MATPVSPVGGAPRAPAPQTEAVIARGRAGNRPGRSTPPPAPANPKPVNRQELAQVQGKQASNQARASMLERVDALVRGMESLAERIASDGLSSSQRTVLASRFNQMERQVNEIDGVVGGEGREVAGRQELLQAAGAALAVSASQLDPGAAAGQRLAAIRREQTQLRAESDVAAQAVQQQFRALPDMPPQAAADTAKAAASGIRSGGAAALQLATSGALVDASA
jgi:hypothetical protein